MIQGLLTIFLHSCEITSGSGLGMRLGCNIKPLQKEVDHHLDLDESRLQLRLSFLG